jgi:hypothetical protein
VLALPLALALALLLWEQRCCRQDSAAATHACPHCRQQRVKRQLACVLLLQAAVQLPTQPPC